MNPSPCLAARRTAALLPPAIITEGPLADATSWSDAHAAAPSSDRLALHQAKQSARYSSASRPRAAMSTPKCAYSSSGVRLQTRRTPGPC